MSILNLQNKLHPTIYCSGLLVAEALHDLCCWDDRHDHRPFERERERGGRNGFGRGEMRERKKIRSGWITERSRYPDAMELERGLVGLRWVCGNWVGEGEGIKIEAGERRGSRRR